MVNDETNFTNYFLLVWILVDGNDLFSVSPLTIQDETNVATALELWSFNEPLENRDFYEPQHMNDRLDYSGMFP